MAGFATQTQNEGWIAELAIESLLGNEPTPTPPTFTLVAYAVCSDNSKHDNNHGYYSDDNRHDYSDDNRHDYSEDDYNNRM